MSTTSASDPVLWRVDERGVARVTLNRPEVYNAYNGAMIEALLTAYEDLADKALRAVVIAGAGRNFQAGADVNWLDAVRRSSPEENLRASRMTAEAVQRLNLLPVPTVALVQGACFGGGTGLIAACDIAAASTDTEFCVSEVRLGLTPATIGPYVLAAMGERAARRYFLTGERFPAAEAYRLGFVQELAHPDELDAAVNAILGELVQGAPVAHAATKDLIRTVARRPLTAELMEDMATRIAAARASEEGRDGVRSFLEKRSPAWVKAAKQAARTKRKK